MDATALWKALGEGDAVLLGLVAAALGAVGGLAHHLATPPDGADRPPPAWWKEMIVGAIAAAAILYVAKPDTPISFVSGSLVAGFAGMAVMNGLAARAAALAARQDVRSAIHALEEADAAPVDARVAGSGLPPAARSTFLSLKARYAR